MSLRTLLPEAYRRLSDPGSNFVVIDGSQMAIPTLPWGRNFELIKTLATDDPESGEKLTRELPKRMQNHPDFWTTYLGGLMTSFGHSFQAPSVKVRFAQISDDQCTYFHTDSVKVRLFQTLQGPGTEYLEESNVDRSGLGQGNNALVVRNAQNVKTVNAKDLLIMRGDLWVPGKGLVHRSPAIEQRGLKRLYLCIDAIGASF